MNDRERLARLLCENIYVGKDWTTAADALLAAGVTLPPEAKPALVTEEMMQAVATGYTRFYSWDLTLPNANRLVEAAIRKAVGEREDATGTVGVGVGMHGATYIPGAAILHFFGILP